MSDYVNDDDYSERILRNNERLRDENRRMRAVMEEYGAAKQHIKRLEQDRDQLMQRYSRCRDILQMIAADPRGTITDANYYEIVCAELDIKLSPEE